MVRERCSVGDLEWHCIISRTVWRYLAVRISACSGFTYASTSPYLHRYFYSGSTFAVTEPDGIRIVSADTCDFIQKVATPSVSVFRPGSTSPSAILFDAFENFSRRSPKADEAIRSIRTELSTAVDECIDAAAREWEPYWQRRLLNVRDQLRLQVFLA